MGTNEFFSDYWEKKPLVVRHPESSFDHIFSIWDVMDAADFDYGDSNVMFRRSGMEAHHPGVSEAYLDGTSVVINHVDRSSPALTDYCASLAEHLIHVYAVMYLTPPGSQAVPPHTDDQDIFILQVCYLERCYLAHTAEPAVRTSPPPHPHSPRCLAASSGRSTTRRSRCRTAARCWARTAPAWGQTCTARRY